MSSLNLRKLLFRITDNWPAKILSVALAIILFVFHRMSILENRFFSVPLAVQLDGNLVPSSAYPRMVRVTLRGEANSVFPILEEDVEAYLDFSRYTEVGTYRSPVQIRKKGTALGVEPLEITVDPIEVTLDLDYRETKFVPIHPQLDGYLETGYEMVSYTLTPTQVSVDGPRHLMQELSGLSTDVIDLGGRNEDFNYTVRILNNDPLLQIRGDGTAEFHGFIKKLIMIRSFENLPIRIDGLREDLSLQMEVYSGAIRIEGNQSELEHYTPTGIILSLDCSHIEDPGSYTLPIQAAIPPVFTLIRSDPTAVKVQVREK
jgi:hypothetical protein